MSEVAVENIVLNFISERKLVNIHESSIDIGETSIFQEVHPIDSISWRLKRMKL